MPLKSEPNHDGWRNELRAFQQALEVKLEAGARHYGDRSFQKSTDSLLDELAAEAIDLAGWGFVLWARIQKLIEVSQPLNEARRYAVLRAARSNIQGLLNTDRQYRGFSHDNGVLKAVLVGLDELLTLSSQPQVETASNTNSNKEKGNV